MTNFTQLSAGEVESQNQYEKVKKKGTNFTHLLYRLGEMIKTACREQHPVRHPIHTDYTGVDILVFYELGWDRPESVDNGEGSAGGGGTGSAGGGGTGVECGGGTVYGRNAVVMSKV